MEDEQIIIDVPKDKISKEIHCLDDILLLIKNLEALFVKSIPLEALKLGVSSQLLHYKIVCTYRMHELSSSAVDHIKRNKIVAAMTLIRAAMETSSALKYIDDKMKTSLLNEDKIIIQNALDKLTMGIKIEEILSNYDLIKCIHINDILKKMNCGFNDDYNFKSEFVHPNAMGTTVYYTHAHQGKSVISFGYPSYNKFKEEGTLQNWVKSLCIKTLNQSLICFISSEKSINNNMMKFIV